MTDVRVLDRAAGVVSELVPSALRRRAARGGQAVLLVPAAFYTSSVFVVNRKASQVLLGLGLATTPAAVAGELAEWSTLDVEQRRKGVVHLVAYGVASACFLTAFRLRLYGFGLTSRIAGLAGLGVLAADAYATQVNDVSTPG
ncbi:hypothetical protein Lesp02_33350 [Lentzea sp. NBRC 105346]|uniref:hypothetical protein n=1 Tax=Lentzea sp. NBRC 105346 TaxID=3032205 RepID=UPI0024A38B0D|nr:hypothetical protein [Lentzea sp. NBRC 105346]GLZ31147.1 hypothetical protein Lesp02_33350 [Lentzea sp. NBRC 105346]